MVFLLKINFPNQDCLIPRFQNLQLIFFLFCSKKSLFLNIVPNLDLCFALNAVLESDPLLNTVKPRYKGDLVITILPR